jgi:hypothetical protein
MGRLPRDQRGNLLAMKLKRRVLKLAFAAALTYFLDPTLGAQRRRKLRSQIEGWRNRRHPAAPLIVTDGKGNEVNGLTSDSELIVPAAV